MRGISLPLRVACAAIRMTRVATSSRQLAISAALATGFVSPAIADAPQPSMADILQMRTIDSLTPSPDGRWMAFRVITPSIARNDNEVRWYATDINSGSTHALGESREATYEPIFDYVKEGVAHWSPNSRYLYVTELDRDAIQIHELSLTGADRAVTHDAADVVSFSFRNGGRTIAYQVRNDRSAIRQAQQAEARDGVRLDRTLITDGLPLTSNFLIGQRLTTIRRVAGEVAGEAYAGDLRTRIVELASHVANGISLEDAASRWPAITIVDDPATPKSIPLGTAGATVVRAVVQAPDSKLLEAVVRVRADLPDGRSVSCGAEFCGGLSPTIRMITPSGRGDEVVIAYERDFSARTGLYTWNPTSGQTRTILEPDASLDGGAVGSSCSRVEAMLLCVQASATKPPRLVRIDLQSGRVTPLFDPNAGLSHRVYGKSRFIEWKDAEGRHANGILLTPIGAHAALPLIVTTYRCRGFLRGGIGMVAPEHVLVARGFATLCVNNNDRSMFTRDYGATTAPLSMQKASLAAYLSGIDTLVSEGIADRTRVGIEGHSYSAMVVAYGISHSSAFSAAVIGTGINIDPMSYVFAAPTADSWRKGYLDVLNLPPPTRDPSNLWQAVSPALNAKAITAPLLMEPAESEYLASLQLFTYMQDAGKPVEMFIYPGAEHLFGRYPVQQLTRANRAIAWFERWLLKPSISAMPRHP